MPSESLDWPLWHQLIAILTLADASVSSLRRILAWVPVGIFFTRHVYSLASITGASMQVSLLALLSPYVDLV